MVGMTRFELAPPATRTRCATRLRYIPTFICNRKTFVLLGCATPLTNRYSIDLLGRVLHPEVFYLFCK